MHGLHTVAWRGIKRRKARSVITVIAVTLGVANVFGVLVVNASIDRGVAGRRIQFASSDAIANPTEVNDADTPLILRLRPQLEKLPGVRAVGFVWGALLLDAPKRIRETSVITAMDHVALEAYARPQLESGRLPGKGRPEVVVRRSVARALRVGIGDRLTSDARKLAQEVLFDSPPRGRLDLQPDAPRRLAFEITGIISDLPGTEIGGPNFTSLDYIWSIFEPDVANEADFILEDGVEPALWVADVQSDFPQLRFDSSAAAPEFRRLLSAIKGMLAGTSTLALFVGAFLIYLTFSMAVVERTRLYGSFHALGAAGRQVASAVLAEALLLGVISSVLGIAAGFALSKILVKLVTGAVPVPVSSPSITASALISALVIGLVVTALGAAAPAIRASRIPPVAAIRDAAPSVARSSRSWVVGAGLFTSGLAFALVGPVGINILTSVAIVAVLAGAVFCVSAVLGPLARVLHRAVRRAIPGIGEVAVMHVQRERSRSAYTLALVMIVLASIVTMATTNGSLRRFIDVFIDKRFGSDLVLYGPNIDGGLQERITAIDGIAGTTPVDFGTTVRVASPSPSSHNLVLIDPETYFEIAGFPWLDGSDTRARAALQRGGSVLVPSGVAKRMQWRRGDRLDLSLGGRTKAFTIDGVYATLGSGPEIGIVGSFVDDDFFRPDEDRNALYIDYEAGASHRSVVADVRTTLAPKEKREPRSPSDVNIGSARGTTIGNYFAITGAEIKQRAHDDFDSFIRIFLAVVLIAAIVGVAGMANTLASSVLLRFRELGILHAVGATPRDVRRMILIESVILTVAAFVLSIGLGMTVSWIFTRIAVSEIGFALSLTFPWALLPQLLVLSILIAVVAAALPARRAARLTPVEALRYE